MRSRLGWTYLLPVSIGARVAVVGAADDPEVVEAAAGLREAGADVAVLERLAHAAEPLHAVVLVRPPAADEWGALVVALRPGGTVLLLPRAAGRAPARTQRTMRAAGLRDVESYLVLPDRSDPRLLAPIGGATAMRGALRLHAATTPRARLVHRLLPIAAATGVLGLAVPAQIAIGRRDGRGARSLAEDLGEVVGVTARPAVLNPSAGVGLKAILRFAGPDGSAVAYAKAAGPGPRADGLAHEAEVLRGLAALPALPFHVPPVRAAGEWGAHRYLLLGPVAEDGAPATGGLDAAVLDALVALAGVEGRRGPLAASGTVERIEAAASPSATVAEAVRRALSLARDVEVPLGIAHGDFVAWNVRRAGAETAVIDWEWATPRGAPFLDLFHFVIHTERHVRGTPVAEVARAEFFTPGGAGARSVRDVARRLGIPDEARARVSFACFLLYLADWHVLQSLHGNEEGSASEHLALLASLLADPAGVDRWQG